MTTSLVVESLSSSESLSLEQARNALARQPYGTYAVDHGFGEEGVSVELIITGDGPKDPIERRQVKATKKRISDLELIANATRVPIKQSFPRLPQIIQSLNGDDTYYQLQYHSTIHVTEPATGETRMNHYHHTIAKQRKALFEVMDTLMQEDPSKYIGVTMRFLQGDDIPSLTFFATDPHMLEEVMTEIDANHQEALEFPESVGRHGIRERYKSSTPEWLQP